MPPGAGVDIPAGAAAWTVWLAATTIDSALSVASDVAPSDNSRAARMTFLDHSTTKSPEAVSVDPCVDRCRSVTPRCRSRRAIDRLALGWATPVARAPADRMP